VFCFGIDILVCSRGFDRVGGMMVVVRKKLQVNVGVQIRVRVATTTDFHKNH
jgi:hypothetical protein